MWFTLAIASGVFAGLHSFGLKVATERKYDSYLLNAGAAGTSFLGALLWFAVTRSWSDVPTSLILYGIVGGALYITLSVMRSEALYFIDATIMFPLYKVVGPASVALIGILFLHEKIVSHELVGIALSCAVPLLLISRQEHFRQKNLRLGLILTVTSTLIASISVWVNTYAVRIYSDASLPLVVISHGCVFFFGLALFLRTHPPHAMYRAVSAHLTRTFVLFVIGIGIIQFLAFYLLLLAIRGGDLSLVYSINAHYILIPVILSIWFYGEHWNGQKAFAIVMSIMSLILLHR